MIELFEKTLLTGIGALSLTQKKAEELIGELQRQFNLSEEKGRELLAKLQETARENQSRLEEVAREEVRKASDRLGLVTAEEFEKLRKKVQQLEKLLKEHAVAQATLRSRSELLEALMSDDGSNGDAKS